MERRAIDLSDEDDVSLSSSAYEADNASLAADGGYENVASSSVRRSEEAEDAYAGYVCAGELRAVEEGSDDDDDDDDGGGGGDEGEEGVGRQRGVKASGEDVLAVGSGSSLSAVALSEKSRRKQVFLRAFAEAKTRRAGETVSEQLERALELADSPGDEALRKASLVLELVRARLAQFAESATTNNNSNNNNAGVMMMMTGDGGLVRWANACAEVRGRLGRVLAASDQTALLSRIPSLVAVPEGLVAAECILKHQLKTGRLLDWNSRFQTLLDLPELTTDDKLLKYQALKNVAQDFTFAAELAAKLIINELSLPDALKTIKPAKLVGGHAGGTKYVCNGILFKLAVDEHQLYGSDANAQKASGHELKSLAAYFDCRIPGLHVPLTTVIDYRGFRVLAMSLVPVDRSTLAYGSDDGGRTVHDDNPTLSKKMRDAAALLNIAGHSTGVRQQKFLYGPCDIEGHLGKDGRMYVLDFARVFPPETPQRDAASTTTTGGGGGQPRYKGGHLYRLLRPELVKMFEGGPLSSDAFSGFGQNNVMADKLVRGATTFLMTTVIPRFAASMDRDPRLAHPIDLMNHLSHMLHRAGINVRFLGRVRHASSDGTFRSILMSEMLARTIKHQLWSGFRSIQQMQALPSEEPYVSLAIQTFNLLLEDTKESADMWFKIKSDVQRYFGRMSMEPWELNPEFDLRRHCRMSVLIRRVAVLSGIVLASDAVKALEEDVLGLFVAADIVRLEPRVKSMNVVEISSAITLSMQAVNLQHRPQEQERLFALAYRKFDSAANASPSNMTTSKYWALTLLTHGQIAAKAAKNAQACVLLAAADAKLTEVGGFLLQDELQDHQATAVRLLASLTGDSGHAASLFVRAVGLGQLGSHDVLASVTKTVEAAQLYASHLAVGEHAYRLLGRVQAALVGVDEFKKLYNALSMDLMDLSNVGLDVVSCQRMCDQLIADGDGKSVRHFIVSMHAKFASLPTASVETGLVLVELANKALVLVPGDAAILEARVRIALLVVCSNPLLLDTRLESLVVTAVREAGAHFGGQWETCTWLFQSFFDAAVFLENTYKTRSSLPLLSLTKSYSEGFLLWDSGENSWLAAAVMLDRLAAKFEIVGRLATALLEFDGGVEAATAKNYGALSLPMLIAIVVHGKPSPALLARISAGAKKVVLEAAFGVSLEAVAAVAKACPHMQHAMGKRGSEGFLAAVEPFWHELQHLDLSLCSAAGLAAAPLSKILAGNAGTLTELRLPGCSDTAVLPVLACALPQLREVQFGWKLDSEVVFSFLTMCPSLSRFVFSGKEEAPVIVTKNAQSERDDLCAGWCRAVSFLLRKTPQANVREVAKSFYRAYLGHNHRGLAVLASGLFVEGQLDGSVVQLIRKLGVEVIAKCVAAYVSHNECDKLFDLLVLCDKLDAYDASSVLGWLVNEMRTRLFTGDMSYFAKFLTLLGEARHPGVFASLNQALVEKLISYVLENDVKFAHLLFSSLLRSTRQNAHTVLAESRLVSELISKSDAFRHSVLSDMKRQMQLLSEGKVFVLCDLLLLILKSGRLEEEVKALPWSLLHSFKIVNIVGLLDAPLLLRIVDLLSADSLRSFGVCFNSTHVREPVNCIDDHVLDVISAKFGGRLTSFELSLTPSVTTVGVKALVSRCGPQLVTLQLRVPMVGDEGIDAIVEHCSQNLRTLRLQCGVHDILLSRMGSQMSITHLDLFDCPYVTVHGLERLISNSMCLWSLRVQDCRHVKLDIMQTKTFVKILTSHRKEADGTQGEYLIKSEMENKTK